MRVLRVCALAIMVFGLPAIAAARRFHFACVDGCLRTAGHAACDIDAKRDGVCTFDICPFRCRGGSPCPPCPAPFAVPLGRHVVKRPGLKLILLCRSSSAIACLAPPTTTTTTTLQPTPSQLITFGATEPFVTLSVRGCVAAVPQVARVTLGEFTCEPSAECPSSRGIAVITENDDGSLNAEATFVDGIKCAFFSVTELVPLTEFRCEDLSGTVTAHGSFQFVAGHQPPCAPGS